MDEGLYKIAMAAFVTGAVGLFWKSISGVLTRIKDLENEANTNRSDHALLAQRVTAFEGQLSLHSSDMKEIRDKVNQIENSITSVGAKVDAMQSLLMQIHEQLQHK
jgi:predicted  nucleic acid-binding Zn-ribbon protein